MADSDGWRIRAAGADDAAALALIGAATFLETFAGILAGDAIVAHCGWQHTPDAYRSLLAAGAQAWLAELDAGGAPVGFALLSHPDLPGAQNSDIELKRIYALSRFHGGGMGRALMDVAVDAAAGFERLLLGVFAGNDRAIAFYRKHGFEPVGERRFDVGGTFYDDIVLARPLTA